MKRIGTNTYKTLNGYCVEKMQDGSWTAYLRLDLQDEATPYAWSSPKHFTRRSAKQAADHHAMKTGRTPLTDILRKLGHGTQVCL